MEKTALHASLSPLVGTWMGAGEVFANPFGPGGPTQGGWRFGFDAGGFNLIHDYREERAGGHVFAGHGVLTVDPATAAIVWFWFDSYGFPPMAPAQGRWEGPRLLLEKVTPRGTGRSVFTLEGETLGYRSEVKLTGAEGFVPVTGGVFRRAPGDMPSF